MTLAAPSIVRKRRGTCFQYTRSSSSTLLLPWNPEKQGARRSHSTLGVLSLPHELGLPTHHRPMWYPPPQLLSTNMLSYLIGYLDLSTKFSRNRIQTKMKISCPFASTHEIISPGTGQSCAVFSTGGASFSSLGAHPVLQQHSKPTGADTPGTEKQGDTCSHRAWQLKCKQACSFSHIH